MNSITQGQVAALAEAMPGVNYMDRAIELYKNSRAGWFSLSHEQGSEDCVTCNEADDETNGSGQDHETGYVSHDYEALFARHEMQPCPGVIGEWNQWSNCDRSCGAGVKIRRRECSDERGPGWCEEDDRELALCNTQKCLSTDVKDGKYTQWSEWSECSGLGYFMNMSQKNI